MATAAHMLSPLPELSRAVSDWVNGVRELTQPRAIHWCEGSDAEARELTAQLLRNGELTTLNPEQFPGCHLYRSAPVRFFESCSGRLVDFAGRFLSIAAAHASSIPLHTQSEGGRSSE